VIYEGHAFYGYAVTIHGERNRRGTVVFAYSIGNDPKKAALELPAWMFDAAVCRVFRAGSSGRVIVSALRSLRRALDTAFDTVLLTYWVCGFALWGSELHRKDVWHLVYGSPLLIILFFHLYGRASHKVGIHAVIFISACAVFLAVFNCLVVQTMQAKVVTPRGIVSMAKPDTALDFLNSHIARGGIRNRPAKYNRLTVAFEPYHYAGKPKKELETPGIVQSIYAKGQYVSYMRLDATAICKRTATSPSMIAGFAWQIRPI
jgi:hypothetical protein